MPNEDNVRRFPDGRILRIKANPDGTRTLSIEREVVRQPDGLTNGVAGLSAPNGDDLQGFGNVVISENPDYPPLRLKTATAPASAKQMTGAPNVPNEFHTGHLSPTYDTSTLNPVGQTVTIAVNGGAHNDTVYVDSIGGATSTYSREVSKPGKTTVLPPAASYQLNLRTGTNEVFVPGGIRADLTGATGAVDTYNVTPPSDVSWLLPSVVSQVRFAPEGGVLKIQHLAPKEGMAGTLNITPIGAVPPNSNVIPRASVTWTADDPKAPVEANVSSFDINNLREVTIENTSQSYDTNSPPLTFRAGDLRTAKKVRSTP